jgi:hypothetical protein
MSRNGSGTYNLPAGNPVVTGTTITSAWANNTLTDIAATLTTSVASDGQTPMSGALNMTTNNINNVGTLAASTVTITNPLAIASGGTNSSATATAGGIPYGTGTAYAFTAVGTSGQVLTSNGSSAPTWSSVVSMTYPGAGIANSTGSAWGTSYTTSGTGAVVALATGATFSNASFVGSSSVLAAILTNAAEVCTISATAATGTIAYYPSTQSVLYYTSNASANWTTNLTFSAGTTLNTAMSTGQSLTVAFLVTQGGTAYYNNVVQVDGTTSGVTTKWQGGTAPTTGNASSVDVYTYTIIKTGSAAFTVLASQTKFA